MHMASGETCGDDFAVTYQRDLSSFPVMVLILQYNIIGCGVPHDSILGPLLFIIYMNGLCNVSELLFIVLYADNASVVIHGKYMSSIITILNHELYMLSTWLKANKLSLNNKLILSSSIEQE